MLKKLAEDTRKDANSERFEAWQQNNRANHFTVTEIWKDRGAVDAHIVAASTRDFRDKLGPMSGALYDERLYQNVE
jgi:quinol monooxygenase YgiN